MSLFPNATKDVKALNPHIFGVGPMERQKPESAAAPALARSPRQLKSGKGNVVAIVSFVAYRRKALDDDNLVGSCKPLRDGVAATLGIDDKDSRVRWQYGLIETAGEEGTLVTVEEI